MNIAIVCYASVGGSGVVATELAKALAARGHQVHVISREQPFRLGGYQPGLSFHRVTTPDYPLFREPQYVLSLSTRLVQLSRELHLDVIHAHYAIPHTAAAYLAKQILSGTDGDHVPKIITTLHGTDITLVGSDPSYADTVAFCIDGSDGVTAVSASLKADTYRRLPVTHDIRVIPNFLDCGIHRRIRCEGLRERLLDGNDNARLVIHVSNFRPVKRAEAVVEIFARMRRKVNARLLLVGEGPDLARALALAREADVADDVVALGEQDDVVPLLSVADLFLLPSEQESFGLAALEAMACEVPVVASRVGGLPEVIEEGRGGYLYATGDLDAMAAAGVRLLTDTALHREVAAAGRQVVQDRFCADRIVPMYEAYYREILEEVVSSQ